MFECKDFCAAPCILCKYWSNFGQNSWKIWILNVCIDIFCTVHMHVLVQYIVKFHDKFQKYLAWWWNTLHNGEIPHLKHFGYSYESMISRKRSWCSRFKNHSWILYIVFQIQTVSWVHGRFQYSIKWIHCEIHVNIMHCEIHDDLCWNPWLT